MQVEQSEQPSLQKSLPPVIHIVSDGLGESAAALASAASAQFSEEHCIIHRVSMVTAFDQIAEFIDVSLANAPGRIVVLHTLADNGLRSQLEEYVRDKEVTAIDLIGPAIDAIAQVTGRAPKGEPGLLRKPSKQYFTRIKAMEFAVEHDDGRNPEQLTEADIILIGVSRTSKTPLSIYLGTFGYKVANVPLALGVEPPFQLFEADSRRIFGLTSNAQLLSEIRYRNLGNATEVAASYADIAYVQEDMDEARRFMRSLGCIVVHTDGRSIEETAQEILRYYSMAHLSPEMPY